MGKTKKKSKKKKQRFKINISLILSVFAIVISLGQLFFDNPFFLKFFNRVEIVATENSISKEQNENHIESLFTIKNIGTNTAKNVEIHLRVLKNDKIQFIPNTFKLIQDDRKDIPARNLHYECDELVPGEEVLILVFSDFKDYLDINSLDTLYFNKTVPKPRYNFGPTLVSLKHSKGQVIINKRDSINLKKVQYAN